MFVNILSRFGHVFTFSPFSPQLKENLSVSVSDEEADDQPDVDSDDEDLSDVDKKQIGEEV